jgi:hypothetical protein
LRRYDDALEIDDVEAVVDYLRSTPAGDHLEEIASGGSGDASPGRSRRRDASG